MGGRYKDLMKRMIKGFSLKGWLSLENKIFYQPNPCWRVSSVPMQSWQSDCLVHTEASRKHWKDIIPQATKHYGHQDDLQTTATFMIDGDNRTIQAKENKIMTGWKLFLLPTCGVENKQDWEDTGIWPMVFQQQVCSLARLQHYGLSTCLHWNGKKKLSSMTSSLIFWKQKVPTVFCNF